MLRNKELIEQMTQSEKISLLSGKNFWNTQSVERLGIPSIMLTDGPHGVRKQGGRADHLGLNASIPATCFPTAATLANSWDVTLLQQLGERLGTEAAAEDVSVLLGPGLNIKRNPLCGRNFEYFSEDPLLAGKLAAAMVQGIQSRGVSACPKHFAVNSQEYRRMCINEVVDERALREIYLEGFRYAVVEGRAKTIMTAYNRVNDSYANENTHLLQDILCGEWGFDGVVVTDWGGENDRVAGLLAGNQLEMPSSGGMTARDLERAIAEGTVTEALLDERVDSLLTLIMGTRQDADTTKGYVAEEHHAFARQAAQQSMVLLKNDNKALPLGKGKRVAVIGDFAENPRYQGAGSSLINPTKLDSALAALHETELEIVGFATGFERDGKKSAGKMKKAVELASGVDTVLLFLGLYEGCETEGVDREHMRLADNQIELLREIRKVAKQVVVVLASGAPVEMPWRGDADAILLAYLSGQAGGSAVADILVGRVSPSGKLAESYPIRYEDVLFHDCYPAQELSSEHRESIYVGYRYYDSADKEVAWPFGFGLSYTSFAYSDIAYSEGAVSVVVTNTGATAGAEVVQLYIAKPNSQVFRAKQELKGFAKVYLQAGERREVTLTLDDHAFCYFNTAVNRWVEEPGDYELRVGASSRDLRMTMTVSRVGELVRLPCDSATLPSYYSARLHEVTNEQYTALLGRALPASRYDRERPLGYDDTIGQGAYKQWFGRFVCRVILFVRQCYIWRGKPIDGNYAFFVLHLPYLRLARLSGGRFNMAMLDSLLEMTNGSFLRGIAKLLRARKG